MCAERKQDLGDKLEEERKKLEDERKKHEEVVSRLKEELLKLEEFGENQQELNLKLEEENADMKYQLRELNYDIESERKSHEVEVKVLSRKLENASKAIEKLETDIEQLKEKYEAKLSEATKKAESLKDQLLSNPIVDQSVQIAQLKERLARQEEDSSFAILELKKLHAEETEAIKAGHNLMVENLQSVVQQQEKSLQAQLDSAMNQLHKARRAKSAEHLAHLQMCSQKDEEMRVLQAEKGELEQAIQKQVFDASSQLIGQMDTLRNKCGQSLLSSNIKMEEVLGNLAIITASHREKDLHLECLQSDLKQSLEAIQNYKDEITRLKMELEVLHCNLDELSQSRDQLSRAKDAEMDELRSKLDQATARNSVVTTLRNVKVDADSGQVIPDQDERNEELLKKNETIHSLQDELQLLKDAEINMRTVNEEANRTLTEKEREMKQMKMDMEALQKRANENKIKFEQQVYEVKCLVIFRMM